MSNQWFVIRCSGGQEDVVGQRLYAKGYLAFCPRIVENGREIALFSSYLFGSFDVELSCRDVLATIGVQGVLGPVREGVVEQLVLECDDNGVFQVEGKVEGSGWRGNIGEEVTVRSGAFVGFTGQIAAINNLRARVEIALLGGTYPISLRHEEIGPALPAAPAGNSRQAAVAYKRYDRVVRGRQNHQF